MAKEMAASLYKEDMENMQQLTQQHIYELAQIWMRVFEHQKCKENFTKLLAHANCFFEELVDESLQMEANIQRDIGELHSEAETLRRLLQTEVTLPAINQGNTPLVRVHQQLDDSLAEMRARLNRRRNEIADLLAQQELICEELGELPRDLLEDPLPSAEQISDFRVYLEQLKQLRASRLHEIAMLRGEIQSNLKVLELPLSTETERELLNGDKIRPNRENIAALQRMHERFKSQVAQVHDSIINMRRQVHTLWDRLETSPRTRQKFARYTEYTQSTYDAYNAELQRCESLKRQNLKKFVDQIRTEITQWWDKCLMSELQRKHFGFFSNNCYTDDLLALHEMELEKVCRFYEVNRKIFELYADRKTLWERMLALEAKANDPGRYKNRGGELLREERERKTIATKLPKIEQQITEMVHDFEARTQSQFLVYGENILDVIAAEWERHRQDKEKLSSARKNATQLTPAFNIRGNTLTARTPISLRNATATTTMTTLRRTPATRATATASTSQKRKLNINERFLPSAKRSLMPALGSAAPATKQKQAVREGMGGSATKGLAATASLMRSGLASAVKRTRVIATTIRRRSGRHSGSGKRRSAGKKSATKVANPTVLVNGRSIDETTTDDYESFEKCIEPMARSSMMESVTLVSKQHGHGTARARAERLQKVADNENERLAQLHNPRVLLTPARRHLRDRNATAASARSPSPMNSTSSQHRKLQIKELPIVI